MKLEDVVVVVVSLVLACSLTFFRLVRCWWIGLRFTSDYYVYFYSLRIRKRRFE